MKKINKIKGTHAELRAMKWLEKQGWECRKTNIQTDQVNKVDVIAMKGKKVLVIQVKSDSYFNVPAGIFFNEEMMILELVKDMQDRSKKVCVIPYYILVGPRRIYVKRLDRFDYASC